MLSTFSATRHFAGSELLIQVLKLLFFLTLWFLGGIFFVPTFLKRAKKLLNDETTLILSIALCLLMVLLAVKVGFSAALGAFVMGSILAETTHSEHIEELVKSVKNLFAAVFFVSVGMMLDPSVLTEYWVPIIMIIVVIIVGMTFTFSIGALISGQSLKHSVQTGMSLAQIGEFSFIIASLGASLNVTSHFLYPIAVAASTFTTFTTPFMVNASTPVYQMLEKRLPERWTSWINRYSTSSQQLSAYNDWKKLLKAYAVNSLIHVVLIGALIFLSRNLIIPYIHKTLENETMTKVVSVVVTLLLTTPSIWALAIRRVEREAYAHLWLNKALNRGPLIMIEVVRIGLAVVLIGVLINVYFSITTALVIAIIAMAIAILLFRHKLQDFYDRLEKRFLSNLNEKEFQRTRGKEIAPWDAHLATFRVHPELPFVGKPLLELRLRERFGINIALIERGKLSILTPDRHERLYPGDQLSIIGTDDQLGKLKRLFEKEIITNVEAQIHDDQITLQNFTITESSRMAGKTIRESKLREAGKGLVVGLERNGKRVLNPESDAKFLAGDIVWVVGVRKSIDQFLTDMEK
jgi:CPA2 family monovalent cation:H+ antiporter-2